MSAAIEVRPLRTDDDRSTFSCGQPDLDRFFQHYAGQNRCELHLAVTYVATAESHILGFATVTASSLERSRLRSARLRRRLPGYPLPVLRLARLGVDTRAQGSGVGRALLRHGLRLALDQRDHLGCVGVVTDAEPDAIAFNAPFGFAPLKGVREAALHGDPTPMFLTISTIAEAVAK